MFFVRRGIAVQSYLAGPPIRESFKFNVEKRRYLPEFVAEAVGLP